MCKGPEAKTGLKWSSNSCVLNTVFRTSGHCDKEGRSTLKRCDVKTGQ